MSDDYLWDRSGPSDPEVERLESVLAPLAHDGARPLRLPAPVVRRSPRTLAAIAALAGAAMLAVIAGGWWLLARPRVTTPAWTVTATAGTPTIESRRIGTRGELRAGAWLETHESGKASIDVGTIGVVDVEPQTRIGLVSARAGDYRLHLARGTMRATIWAPPGQFFVQTPSSVAVDLGCAYTLTVDDGGAGIVRVRLGWVGFGWRGREAFIPAGAMCRTRPGIGPGTPRYEDAAESFHAAIDAVDFGTAGERPAALARALALARDRDAMTLWHLLSTVDVRDRDRVFETLARFVPPPPAVTGDGIRAGRRDMLDAWWDALGLGTASWWRTWKQPWQDDTQGGR